jgi:response regulator RpfG family c-di-GMP phosphodiesterase
MKIIFVSESLWQGELLQVAFGRQGHELVPVGSASQLLNLIDNDFYPDIIITDYFLPDSDAVKMMSILSSYPDTAEIPIVFYTFIPELEQMLRGGLKSSYGIKDVIYAPSNSIDQLISRIEKIELRLG